MATVMISNPLLQDVRHVIGDLKYKELKSPTEEMSKLATTIANGYSFEEAKRKLWGEHLHLAPPVMPEQWCDRVSTLCFEMTFTFDIHTTPSNPKAWTASREVNVLALAGAPDSRMLTPPNTGRYIKLTDMRQHCTPEQFEQMHVLYDEVQAITEKYKTLRDQIEGVLKAHPSLNKALFAYPELKRIVPKQYLDRVEEPTARAKREAKERPEAPQLDRDALLNSIAISNLISH